MKRVVLFLIILMNASALKSRDCPDPQTIDRLQQLQRDVDTIKSKVCINQHNTIDIESSIEDISIQISEVESVLCSKIDNIDVSTVDAVCSGIDELSVQLSLVEQVLCSKIDNIDVSTVDAVCSGIDELSVQLSITDASLCSKVGMLDDDGSCLDQMITVPQDIDNLELSTIALLKTILLELRGCNAS
jgi:hypothetical protein